MLCFLTVIKEKKVGKRIFLADRKMQPRPQGAFPWLWGRGAPKAREKRPGDEVAENEMK